MTSTRVPVGGFGYTHDMMAQHKDLVILTIGHSTHPIDKFIEMLKASEVELLVDIRTIPRSRRNPQFEGEALSQSLLRQGIEYVYLGQLGGLRRTSAASLNKGWRNASFRGYADYMQTPEFAEGLEQLIGIAREKTTVIMCAEAVPWRCHRSLVADALIVRGIVVKDIMSVTSVKPRKLNAMAVIDGESLTYPKDLDHGSEHV